jgi:acetyl esterase/lipase
MAGEREILRPEVDRLIESARRYQVPLEIVLWPDVFHSWHALVPDLPEAMEAMGEAIRKASTLAKGLVGV